MSETAKTLMFIDKETKERVSFIRTLLHTFVRESDGKVFSQQNLYKKYNDIPLERKVSLATRFCIKCRLNHPTKEFFIGENTCRSCMQTEAHKKKANS